MTFIGETNSNELHKVTESNNFQTVCGTLCFQLSNGPVTKTFAPSTPKDYLLYFLQVLWGIDNDHQISRQMFSLLLMVQGRRNHDDQLSQIHRVLILNPGLSPDLILIFFSLARVAEGLS